MHRNPFLLALTLVILCSVCALSASAQVKYQFNSHQLTFLIPKPSGGEALVTFPSDITVKEAQASSAWTALGIGCTLQLGPGVESTSQVRHILRSSESLPGSSALQLACSSGAFPLVPVPLPWREGLTEEDREKIRVTQERHLDWLAHGISDSQEYGHTLVNYLHNTALAIGAWFVQFSTNHWGSLHPFPEYNTTSASRFDGALGLSHPDTLALYTEAIRSLAMKKITSNQVPNLISHLLATEIKEDTGLYHMNTGRVLTPAQSKFLADLGNEENNVRAGPLSTNDDLDHNHDYSTLQRDTNSLLNDEEIRISITADWGSGTAESDAVSSLMVSETNPHYTIHIGDVYYVGTPNEIKTNCLGEKALFGKKGVLFRGGSLGTFAYQGNHEMYSRGYGYFDHWLPAIGIKDKSTGKPRGQKTSYSALDNKYWRVIGLDTGYKSYSPLLDNEDNRQPQAVIDWLVNVVKINDPNDKRGIILLSHHQYRSAFESNYYPTPEQLSKLIPNNRTVLWLWGHEHRVAWYDLGKGGEVDLNVYGRCIGVGGFPVERAEIPGNARATGLLAYDNRKYDTELGIPIVKIGYNGFTTLKFIGRNVTLEYRSLIKEGEEADGTSSIRSSTEGNVGDRGIGWGNARPRFDKSSILVREVFSVDDNGSVKLLSFKPLEPKLTTISHEVLGRGDVNNGYTHADKVAREHHKQEKMVLITFREQAKMKVMLEVEERRAQGKPMSDSEVEQKREEIFVDLAKEYIKEKFKIGKPSY